MENTGKEGRSLNLFAAWQELTEQAAQQAAQGQPWLLRLLADKGATLAPRYALWKGRLRRMRLGQQKWLRRKLGAGMVGAALLLALSGAPTVHAGNPIVVDGAICTLADAITAANTDAAVGGCTTGYAGADIIDVQADVALTTANNTTYGATGLPVITSEVTVAGNDHSISRSASTNFRILAVAAGGNLTLNSVTVHGGAALGSGPYWQQTGGGVFVKNATITVMNSTLSANRAHSGGGIFAQNATVVVTNSALSESWADSGGGMFVEQTSLSVTGSTLSDNRADSGGGGMATYSSTVTVSNSTISGNAAATSLSIGAGGGIRARASTLVIADTTMSGNFAADSGGGIDASSAMITIARSSLEGNMSSNPLGGGSGGGISVANSTLIVANSTLSGNLAGLGGGGIGAFQASVVISDSTLNHNWISNLEDYGFGGGINVGSSTLTVLNSLLSDNTADIGGGIEASGSTLVLSDSKLSGNQAWSYSGGGINIYASTLTISTSTLDSNLAETYGGGISGWSTEMVISGSTLSGNSASSYGGGIHTGSASLTISNSTLSGNSAAHAGGGIHVNASQVTLRRSLISGNVAGAAGNEVYNNASAITAANFNLFGHKGETNAQAFTNFTPSGSDITATWGGKAPTTLAGIVNIVLADNDSTVAAGAPPGSIVQTLALPSGSPAVDKAPSADCIAPAFDLDQRAKPRNTDGDGSASSNECDIGAFELQTASVQRIIVHKQTMPNGDPTEFQFELRGPVGRDFTLADDEPHSTGQIPEGIYTLEEILPPGWDPAIPLASMTCDDGSPLSALDLAADEVLLCHFLNYKRGNIIVKKATIPPVASPNFAMKLVDASSNAQTLFSLANGGQFDTGALSSVPTYKLLEPAATLPGGWKKKSIACDNGSPATAIVVPPGGSVTCTVTNENSVPTNILLSNTSVDENKAVGTVVGALSASDAIAGDTHTFSFVNDGTPGASGNGSFQIVGNQLQTNAVFDYETKTSYNIKLKATDTAGQSKVKNFVIRILDKPG